MIDLGLEKDCLLGELCLLCRLVVLALERRVLGGDLRGLEVRVLDGDLLGLENDLRGGDRWRSSNRRLRGSLSNYACRRGGAD